MNQFESQSGATPAPTKGQRALAERGYGMFIHFGVNTMNEIEWSDGTLPIDSYQPSDLDCDQWVRVAKEAGFRHVVLVTKHHDGFVLWPSAHGDYGVANSPVTTDVVGAVADACRRYGVQLGLYYSLWDRFEPTHDHADPGDYVEIMKLHLTELLTQYGDICELWFDGGWAKPAEDWRMGELHALIAELQPDCQVTSNHTVTSWEDRTRIVTPTEAQIGDPLRYWPMDFRTKDPNFVRRDDPKLYTAPDGHLVYLPFEHTVCLSEWGNWFQKKTPAPPRSVDELEELFYWCTSQQNALLLNVPPGPSGRLEQGDVEAILGVADRLGIRGGQAPLPGAPVDKAFRAVVTSDGDLDEEHAAATVVDGRLEGSRWIAANSSGMLTLSFDEPISADRVVLQEHAETEDLGDGFSLARRYSIESVVVELGNDDQWTVIHEGGGVGAAAVIQLPEAQRIEALRVRVVARDGNPSIVRIAVAQRALVTPR